MALPTTRMLSPTNNIKHLHLRALRGVVQQPIRETARNGFSLALHDWLNGDR